MRWWTTAPRPGSRSIAASYSTLEGRRREARLGGVGGALGGACMSVCGRWVVCRPVVRWAGGPVGQHSLRAGTE